MGDDERRQRLFSLIERLWYSTVTDEGHLWTNDDARELDSLVPTVQLPLNLHPIHDEFVFLGLDSRNAGTYSLADILRAVTEAMREIRVPEAIDRAARTNVMAAMCRLVRISSPLISSQEQRVLIQQRLATRLAPLRTVAERIEEVAYAAYRRAILGGQLPDVEKLVQAARRELHVDTDAAMGGQSATVRRPVFGLTAATASHAFSGGRGSESGSSRRGRGTGGRAEWQPRRTAGR